MKKNMKQRLGALLLALTVTCTFCFMNATIPLATTTSPGEGKAAYQYGTVNIGGGGFVTGILSTNNPDIFYARTDVGGAYRLDAATGVWTPLSEGLTQEYYGGLGVDSIAVDPADANTVYIFCGYTYTATEPSLLMRSTDGGKTFTYIKTPFQSYGNGMARNVGERLVVDPLNTKVLYCATRQDGVWKSSNSGNTWTKIREHQAGTNTVGTCMVFLDDSHPINGLSRVYVADWSTSNQFYCYSGSGTTWESINCTALSGAYPQRCTIANQKAYITFANTDFENGPESGYLGIFDFASQSFTKQNVSYGSKNYPLSGISISEDGNMLVSTLNTYEDLYRNEDTTQTYGEEWGTALFTSTDNGATWTNVNKTQRICLKNNGKDWVEDEKPHWSGDVTFFPNDSSKALLSSGNGTYLLTSLFDNDGKVYASFYTEGMEETVVLDIVAPAKGLNELVSVAYDAGGFAHTNILNPPKKRIGTSYSKDTQQTVSNKGVAIDKTGIAVCESNPSLMLMCGETDTTSGTSVAALQYSKDGGANWYEVPGSSTLGERGSCAIAADGSAFYWMPTATTDRYTENVGKDLYRFDYQASTDTFSAPKALNVNGGTIQGARVLTDTVNASLLYVSSREKLYYSKNQGNTFSTIASSDTGNLNRMTVVPGFEGLVYEANGRWSKASLSFYDCSQGTNTLVSNVTECEAIGFGKAAANQSFPAMYIWGTIDNTTGFFRSIDRGESWVQINDSNTQFGGIGNGKQIVGDMRTFGRFYFTTYGQGIIYGNSIENAPASTEDTSSTEDKNPDSSTDSSSSTGDTSSTEDKNPDSSTGSSSSTGDTSSTEDKNPDSSTGSSSSTGDTSSTEEKNPDSSTGSSASSGNNSSAETKTNSGTNTTTDIDKKDASTTTSKTVIPKPAKAMAAPKLTAKKRALKVSWKRIKKASGYEIQLSTKKSMKGAKTIRIAKNKKSYTVKKLKKRRTYYVRIRSYQIYKTSDGTSKKVYSYYSKIVKKKTK